MLRPMKILIFYLPNPLRIKENTNPFIFFLVIADLKPNHRIYKIITNFSVFVST